jgi:hypothetical protein
MARRSPNCALAACVMFLAESAISEAIMSAALVAWLAGRFPVAVTEPVATLDILFPYGLAHTFLYFLPLVAGAWWMRRRAEPQASSWLASG